MQIASLSKNVDIIKEPVEEIAAPRDYIGELEKGIGVTLMNDLDAPQLKQWLKDSEQLTCFSDSFYIYHKQLNHKPTTNTEAKLVYLPDTRK